MMRRWAVAAAILCVNLPSAAGAFAQAAAPFPVVDISPPPPTSHRLANIALLGGVALIGASFALERRADEHYAAYLTAIDPAEISQLYDLTVRDDHLSSAALIAGNVLVATGLYLRFVRHPRSSHLSLAADLRRCAVTYSF